MRTRAVATRRCTRTRTTDSASGFRRAGGSTYSTGTLMVTKDASDLVGAMIFPARLHRTDISAEHIGTVVAQGLERIVRGNGGAFSLSDQRTMGSVATAVVHATIGGVPVSGPLQIVVKPGFATVKLFWAPDGQLAAEQRDARAGHRVLSPEHADHVEAAGRTQRRSRDPCRRSRRCADERAGVARVSRSVLQRVDAGGLDRHEPNRARYRSAVGRQARVGGLRVVDADERDAGRSDPEFAAAVLSGRADPETEPGPGAARMVDRQRGVGDSGTPARHLARVDEPQGRAVDGMVGRTAAMGSRGARRSRRSPRRS